MTAVMNLDSYVVALVVATCACIGYIIKNIIPVDKINRFIPLIMGCTGVFLNVWLNHWTITPDIFIEGLASGLASTGAFEMVKNLVNKGEQ